MIQGDLHRPEGAKAIGSSGHYADFIVQTLDRAAGQLTLRSKPIQDQWFMATEHPGRLLHRREATAQRAAPKSAEPRKKKPSPAPVEAPENTPATESEEEPERALVAL